MFSIQDRIQDICDDLSRMPEDEAIDAINAIKLALHRVSPLRDHPVDCVLWIRQEQVKANNYNPNRVAPPEMTLLERSIRKAGYTQPVVTWLENATELDSRQFELDIVDGFHRSLVAAIPDIFEDVRGRLPITMVNQEHADRSDLMVLTIMADRARGTFSIELMQHIVTELVEAGMSDKWIMQHIGMDVDELLRLKQLTGLAALFRNAEFSRAWVAGDEERLAVYDEK